VSDDAGFDEDVPAATRETLDRAATAVAAGDVVVYPTETVYGLGADALDADAVGPRPHPTDDGGHGVHARVPPRAGDGRRRTETDGP
jgi:hypothetical protein